MKKHKIIVDYLLAFGVSLIVTLLSLMLVIRFTVFNNNYIKNNLVQNDYYDNLSKEIIEDMKSYIVSSGLSDEVLNDLFTIDQLTNDVENYVDYLFGNNIIFDENHIRSKLQTNIDQYLKKYQIKISDTESLELFIEDIVGIYYKEVSLYGYLNNYVQIFNKINSILNIFIIVTIVVLLVCLIIYLKVFNAHYIDSSIMSSGLSLIFIRYYLYNRIDIDYLIIITDNFSSLIKYIFHHICYLFGIIGSLLIVVGAIFIIVKYCVNNKKMVLKNNE